MDGDAVIPMGDGEIVLHQRTDYPYSGEIALQTETDGTYTIAMRVPAWCTSYTLKVNGVAWEYPAEKGYILLRRTWCSGDEAVLVLDMAVEQVEANPRVPNLCGHVAITRGPLVFCAEGIDNPGVRLNDVRIGRDAEFACREEEINGRRLPVLRTQGKRRCDFSELYRPRRDETEQVSLTLIPYLAWANRGITEMKVWFLSEE